MVKNNLEVSPGDLIKRDKRPISSRNHKQWNEILQRRDLLKRALYLSLGGTVGWHVIEEFVRQLPESGHPKLDAYELLNRQNYFLSNQNILMPKSLASEQSGVNIVFIRVMNLIHTPLFFRLLDFKGTTQHVPWENKITSDATKRLLFDRGLKENATNRFGPLRLNKWFADILFSGRDETGTSPDYLSSIDKGDFPDEVALQCFLNTNQNLPRENHSFKNTLMEYSSSPNSGGDLGFHLHQNNLVHSPFGIAALNMGQGVETTDGSGRVANRILGADLQQLVANGKSVQDYVKVLLQSMGTGFIENNFVEKLDRIAGFNSDIRTALNSARSKIQDHLVKIRKAGEIEKLSHLMGDLEGANNVQAARGNPNQTANLEFVAQCALAASILDIPDTPIRNFSLLLNIFDVDNTTMDITQAQGISRPLSNIEGTRQMAMGLNLLAHSIKRNPKTIVVVAAEGGRAGNGGDNKISHMFVMGSKTDAELIDHLYTDPAIFKDDKHPYNGEPNAGNTSSGTKASQLRAGPGLAYYTEGDLKNTAGETLLDEFPTVSSVLNGVVRRIETMVGHDKVSTVADLGNYVKLRTKPKV